jgi:acyl-CoA thioester hydrolase
MMGAWMNLKTRKLSSLPKELLVDFSSSNKTIDFKTLKASDTRKHGKMPKNLK